MFDLLCMKTLIIFARCLYYEIVRILGTVFYLKKVNTAFIKDYRGVEMSFYILGLWIDITERIALFMYIAYVLSEAQEV